MAHSPPPPVQVESPPFVLPFAAPPFGERAASLSAPHGKPSPIDSDVSLPSSLSDGEQSLLSRACEGHVSMMGGRASTKAGGDRVAIRPPRAGSVGSRSSAMGPEEGPPGNAPRWRPEGEPQTPWHAHAVGWKACARAGSQSKLVAEGDSGMLVEGGDAQTSGNADGGEELAEDEVDEACSLGNGAKG